jgi:hypothetical protein
MSATTTRRQPTEHAQTAKAIRTVLKAAYPRIPFSVTSESYSGGNAVRIHWTDGPASAAVEALTDRHEQGHFDGMIDLYEYSNVRKDIPQVKYITTQRAHSPEALAGIVAQLNQYWGWELRVDGNGWIDPASDAPGPNGYQSHEIHRWFHRTSLVCPACGSPTLPQDKFCPACGAAIPAPER